MSEPKEYMFSKKYKKVKNGINSQKISLYTLPKDAEAVLGLTEGDLIIFKVIKYRGWLNMGILNKIKEKVNSIKEERKQRKVLKKEIEAEIMEEVKPEIRREVKEALKDKIKQDMKDQILGKKKNALAGLAGEFKAISTDDKMDRLLGRRTQSESNNRVTRQPNGDIIIDVTPKNTADVLNTQDKIDYMLGKRRK